MSVPHCTELCWQPVLDHFKAQRDPGMEDRMLGLATAFTCTVGQPHTSASYRLGRQSAGGRR